MNERKEVHMCISFEAILTELKSRKIVKVPLNQSKELPSRGMVMGKITVNNIDFIVPLEPDGKGSHWFELSDTLCNELGVSVNQNLSFRISSVDEWEEPEIPEDLMNEIIRLGLLSQWEAVTTKAKWDWLRWIRSTNNSSTRAKRIQVACSKLEKGDKRPCCFDRSRCTIMDVSKSGILLE